MQLPHKMSVLLHKLDEAGCGPVHRAGAEYRCRCPAHADNGPSLYVRPAEDKILIHCNAGCDYRAVCDSLDHDVADLSIDADEPLVEAGPDVADMTEDDILLNGHGGAAEPPGTSVVDAHILNGQGGASGCAVDDADVRHDVYSGLLDRLELSTDHFDDLRRRGLPESEIAFRGYRTADAARIRAAVDELLGTHGVPALLGVPGFEEKDGRIDFRAKKGLLIPARDDEGRIRALKVRHGDGHPGPKYTWASGPGNSCGNPAHVPLGVSAPDGCVRLTEGELKADVATVLSGTPTVSAPGVASWEAAVPALQALGAQRVLLAMDQDGKRNTLAAIERAILGLKREKFDVRVEWWDGSLGKGVDDLLAGGGQPEVLDGLDALVRVRDRLAGPAQPAEEPEPEPAPFPVDVFPPALAAYCEQVAAETSTPPDFAGVTMLVTAAAAVGNSRALCVKGKWHEAPRFYAAIVTSPSGGKSPALDQVLAPYKDQQTRAVMQYKLAVRNYEKAKTKYDQELRNYRSLPADERPAPPVPPDEPVRPERLCAVDATVESLAPVLENNPRGLLMCEDEGVGWVRGMGQYKKGKGNDRQFWLSTWSGQDYMVDRKSQGPDPIVVPRPFINVICGLPPDMLNELADHQGRNDGFVNRVLFVMPEATVGADWTETTVAQESKEAWTKTLEGLRKLKMCDMGDGVPGYQVVRFSPAAKASWVTWYDSHAREIRDPQLPLTLLGAWGKLKGYAARLVLLMHLLWLVQGNDDEHDVEAVSVERAVRLIDYFKTHLRLVYGRLRQTPEDNHLMEVLHWIRQRGGQCRARDLVSAKKVTPTPKAKKMIAELVDRGYGRTEWHKAANGKNVQMFVLEPE